nr:transmembrane protein 18 [Tanacetum cinerariifolium]
MSASYREGTLVSGSISRYNADSNSHVEEEYRLSVAGVYLAERLNAVLSDNWKSFAGQKYLDHHGVFLSVLWSGPLLVFSTIILVNTLFSLCQLTVIWKRAELKHCARLSSTKRD